MSMMMMLALGSARLQTDVFTANGTWVAPAGVTNVISISGKGAAGAPASIGSDTATFLDVSYRTSGSAGSGNFDWAGMNNAANSILAALNAGGTVTVQGQFVTVYPDQTNTLVSASFTRYNVVPGSASYSTNNMWQSSGPATGSGFATHFWSYTIPASNGANATGLGKTFPGGTAGGAAPTTSFSNVAVTPGTSYPIVVPAGGQVSISYMK